MHLTDRINRIQISPTAAVIAEADRLKAKGVDIADFGPGEPDFPTPDHIKKAAVRAIQEDKSKYTSAAGIMPLREAICAWHKRELHSAFEPKECVVSVGGKHSIFNVVSVLVQKGDEVIYGRYSGSDVEVDGREVKIMRESDILAKVTK